MSDDDVVYLELPHSILPPEIPQRFDEVTLRAGGEVWRIHLSDADPFPSKPHAHNLENGLKLDLSNGKLYRGGRDTKAAISRKNLLMVREAATEKRVELPPLAA